MMDNSLDDSMIDWREEAEAVIRDIGFALESIAVSRQLPQTPTEIYFNVKTKEGNKLCVELSSYGFRVVSNHFDKVEEEFQDQTYYETPYALMDKYSDQFRHCFAAALQRKLSDLAELT